MTYIFLCDSSKDMIQLPKVVDIMKAFGNDTVDPILLKHSKVKKALNTLILIVL